MVVASALGLSGCDSIIRTGAQIIEQILMAVVAVLLGACVIGGFYSLLLFGLLAVGLMRKNRALLVLAAVVAVLPLGVEAGVAVYLVRSDELELLRAVHRASALLFVPLLGVAAIAAQRALAQTWPARGREAAMAVACLVLGTMGLELGVIVALGPFERSSTSEQDPPWETVDWTPPGRAVQVASDGFHACARFEGGAVACDETGGDPELVAGITTATDVGVGAEIACALLRDLTVTCWRGRAGSANYERVERVRGATGLIGMDVGRSSMIAWDAGGRVVVWPDEAPPALDRVVSASSSVAGACAVRGADGTVVCWSLDEPSVLRETAAVDAVAVAVAIGDEPCFLDLNGAISCAADGQPPRPVPLPAHARALEIVSDTWRVCARLTTDAVVCFSPRSSDAPAPVAALTGATALSGQSSHICASFADRPPTCVDDGGNVPWAVTRLLGGPMP
jgi:hypothetical protein